MLATQNIAIRNMDTVPVKTTRVPRLVNVITNYRAYHQDVQFMPDGSIVTVGHSNVINFYAKNGDMLTYCLDLSSDYPVGQFRTKGINCLGVSPDGSKLAIGIASGDMLVYDISLRASSGFTRIFKFDHLTLDPESKTNVSGYTNRTVNAVCWSQDGNFLYVGGAHYVYKLDNSGSVVTVFNLTLRDNVSVQTIKVSSDRVIVGTWDGAVYLFDHSGNKLMEDRVDCWVRAIGIDEQSNCFYTCVGNERKPTPLLTMYNLETGSIINQIRSRCGSWVRSIAVSHSHIYLACNDDLVYVYTKDMEFVRTLYGEFCHCESVEISPDGSKLLAYDSSKVSVMDL